MIQPCFNSAREGKNKSSANLRLNFHGPIMAIGGRGASSLQKMNNMEQMAKTPGPQRPREDKVGIAAHFDVGIRTIEYWRARGIISAQRKGKKLEFDVQDCDRRVSAHAKPKWANKETTAEHYQVSPRTITNWQTLGLLVCFKIGRVVRYDLVGSDASLREHGMI